MIMPSEQRIVVTGMGAVTSLGLTPRSMFRALVESRTGITRYAWPELSVHAAGPVTHFEAEVDPDVRGAANLGRYSQFAWHATRDALRDSGLRSAGYAPERIATVIGVGMGGWQEFEYQVAEEAKPTLGTDLELLRRLSPQIVTDVVAREAGATGPNRCIVSACASSAHAIGESFALLKSGRVDAVIAGGAEAALTPVGLASFERICALSRRECAPEEASRPFDRDRDGFVMGEGAGILILETEASAKRRGAPIYAELLGYGASADAFHVTRPPDDGNGMARAIALALRSAAVNCDEVDYVNAHGTSTPLNDAAETQALKRVFGDHARKLWISSNKSMLGHLLGAAAAVETVATIQTLNERVVPPTLNLEHPDPACDLDYVPQSARDRGVRIAIKNSFGFGGQNATRVSNHV
jgi:3-oxoacyl-[acyl-carrier-protein] synthase II